MNHGTDDLMDALAGLDPVGQPAPASPSDAGLRAVLATSRAAASEPSSLIGQVQTPGAPLENGPVELRRSGRAGAGKAGGKTSWVIGALVLALAAGGTAFAVGAGVLSKDDGGISPLAMKLPADGTVLGYAGRLVGSGLNPEPAGSLASVPASGEQASAPAAPAASGDIDPGFTGNTVAAPTGVVNPASNVTAAPGEVVIVQWGGTGPTTTTTVSPWQTPAPGDPVNLPAQGASSAAAGGQPQSDSDGQPVAVAGQDSSHGVTVVVAGEDPTSGEAATPGTPGTSFQPVALRLQVKLDSGTLRVDTNRCLVDGTGSYTMGADGSWSFDPGQLAAAACPGEQASIDYHALIDTLTQAKRWSFTDSDPNMLGSFYVFTGQQTTVYLAVPDPKNGLDWPAFGTLAPQPFGTPGYTTQLVGSWRVADLDRANAGVTDTLLQDWTLSMDGYAVEMPAGCTSRPADGYLADSDGRWFYGSDTPMASAVGCAADLQTGQAQSAANAMLAATDWQLADVSVALPSGVATWQVLSLVSYASGSYKLDLVLVKASPDGTVPGWSDSCTGACAQAVASNLQETIDQNLMAAQLSGQMAAQESAADAAAAQASAAQAAKDAAASVAGEPGAQAGAQATSRAAAASSAQREAASAAAAVASAASAAASSLTAPPAPASSGESPAYTTPVAPPSDTAPKPTPTP